MYAAVRDRRYTKIGVSWKRPTIIRSKCARHDDREQNYHRSDRNDSAFRSHGDLLW